MSASPTSGTTSSPRPRLRRNRRRKTCVPCAKSKRKCDQSMPFCKRCMEKEVVCIYPPRRTGLVPSLADNEDIQIANTFIPSMPSAPSTSGGASSSTSKGKHYESLPRPPRPMEFDAAHEPSLSPYQWFLSPESWQHSSSLDAHIMSLPPELEISVSQDSLPHYINKQQGWLRLWTKEGHSPLIHRNLYRDLMPECIRDAYTASAAYDMACTPAAKTLCLRIMQDRATELIQCQPDFHIDLGGEDGINLQLGALDASTLMLGTFNHLARTQALFVYQMTQLFDGDIRSRDQAEAYMETLHRWACQMLESARLDCTSGQMFGSCASSSSSSSSSSSGSPGLSSSDLILGIGSNTACSAITPPSSTHNPFTLPPNPAPHTLWQVWVIAESVRRTYISVCFTRGIYQTMKTQWSTCPGGVLFSALRGLWDAESGRQWCAALKAGSSCHQKVVEGTTSPWALMQSLEVWKVLEYASPDEVDEFTVAVAEISRGMEVVEQWMMEKGARES